MGQQSMVQKPPAAPPPPQSRIPMDALVDAAIASANFAQGVLTGHKMGAVDSAVQALDVATRALQFALSVLPDDPAQKAALYARIYGKPGSPKTP